MASENRKYTKTHEWVQEDNGEVIIGITALAQEQLGEIVFVELPEVSRSLERGEEMVVIESVKAACDVYAPVSGRVTAVNEALADNPGLVNQEALGDGWLVRLEPADAGQLEELLSEKEYEAQKE